MSATIRCAIYTRKSTEDGLDQEFNSLDAQREACEAFIKSQRGEGWTALATQYNDGGLSGGTMNRPALRILLSDIEKGRVDTVVVYKVDRLTRSLADFARIVDVFDAQGVSFVSVTQQFNTTTSMGRLTLNMLLSFAQFEREVTGERIRDKIAASKKKGMWMGGLPPLGYDAQDKKLVVNSIEAETVRTLFNLYLELGTVKMLVEQAGHLKLVTKRRLTSAGSETGGKPFTRGHLYQLLSNPIYVGEIAHKKLTYPGQHDAIIDRETFDAARRQLEDNAADRVSATNSTVPSLLTGLIYDDTGDRLCPTHANKKGRRYRYYISKRLMHRTDSSVDGWRLPAKELDGAVSQAVHRFLTDELRIIDALHLTGMPPDQLRSVLNRAAAAVEDLDERLPKRRRQLLRGLLHGVTLHTDALHIVIKHAALKNLVSANGVEIPGPSNPLIMFIVPMALKRRGVEAKLIVRAVPSEAAAPDQDLIALVVTAHRWFEQLVGGEIGSIRQIAQSENINESDVGNSIQLAFLAPDIIEAILNGRQPVDLTAGRLRCLRALPQEWDHQRRILGFPA